MQIKLDDKDNLIVEIPMILLTKNQETKEDIPLRITDNSKMLRWLNSKQGKLTVEQFFSACLLDAYEHGEAWLEGVV